MFLWSRCAEPPANSRPRCHAAFWFSAWRSPPRPPSRRAEAVAAGAAELERVEAAPAQGAAAQERGRRSAGGGGGARSGRRRRSGQAAAEREAAAAGAIHRSESAPYRAQAPDDLTTCAPGQVWDRKHHRCLRRSSGILPDSELTEYAYALAKADRFQEAIDVLDMLDNPNTPRALNYRGYATRKLGRTDEGIGYYLKSVALDPVYPQVREYLGEAYVIEGKFDLAKDQLATIGKICGTQCEYYGELAKALADVHAL